MQTHILLEFDGDLATLTLTPDDPGKPPTLDYDRAWRPTWR